MAAQQMTASKAWVRMPEFTTWWLCNFSRTVPTNTPMPMAVTNPLKSALFNSISA
jgi:hypothetical protein